MDPEAQPATVDLDRASRCGFPEVVYGPGKSAATIVAIARELLAKGQRVLVTRLEADQAAAIAGELPGARYNSTARTLRVDPAAPSLERRGCVAVITAGTSDLPVAEEARETLDWMGVDVRMIADVGVAGPHRLPARLADFADADAVVVVAGMEGALPSVVGGYVRCPVFAVPTSVGYGASFGGIAPLLTMLNSCAANVAVVNIDAGFKAGYLAGLVARRTQRRRESRPMTLQDHSSSPLPQLAPRRPDSHKGDFGRVLVVAGSRGMAGAAALTGLATLRSGAGLVTVATPASVQATVASFSPCYMTVPLVEDDDGIADFANIVDLTAALDAYDVWAIGPGLGRSAGVAELVAQLYRDVRKPMVVDADGLNALATALGRNPGLLDKPGGYRLLTPHPGEFARLAGGAAAGSATERAAKVAKFCQRDSSGRTVTLLKGHETVVGDGERYAVNRTGNPGMATGGTGDCLTGVAAALLAQGLEPWDAARLAAHVHGLAGDLAASELGETSLIASDLVDYLPAAFRRIAGD